MHARLHCSKQRRVCTEISLDFTCNINRDFSFHRMPFAVKTTFKAPAILLPLNKGFLVSRRVVDTISLCRSAHARQILPHHMIHSKKRRTIIQSLFLFSSPDGNIVCMPSLASFIHVYFSVFLHQDIVKSRFCW